MARWRYYAGSPDTTFSYFQRSYPSPDWQWIDTDGMEVCRYCGDILAVQEFALDVGQSRRDKKTRSIEALGRRAHVPTHLVFYDPVTTERIAELEQQRAEIERRIDHERDKLDYLIAQFRVYDLGTLRPEQELTQDEYARMMIGLRQGHTCYQRRTEQLISRGVRV